MNTQPRQFEDETGGGLATPTGKSAAASALWIWRLAQVLIWAAGMFIWAALLWKPRLGLHLLWNVLIPIAPALFVVAPGVWRNLCPLGSLSLAPSHFGLSQGRRLSPIWRGRLYLGALCLLLIVVPLRKCLLDTNGPILAGILFVVGLLAIALGFIFNWKSGWCSSLCPVYPVELLYGSKPLISVPNAHCPRCTSCVAPCSESTVLPLTPATAVNTRLGRWVGVLLTGCFPGFIFGWYQVPTYHEWEGIHHVGMVYTIPYLAACVTLALYLGLRTVWWKQEPLIASIFAAAAVTTYYWFRLPPIFGIGDHNAAMIADISGHLPSSAATAVRVLELLVLGWLILRRSQKRRAWERPPTGHATVE